MGVKTTLVRLRLASLPPAYLSSRDGEFIEPLTIIRGLDMLEIKSDISYNTIIKIKTVIKLADALGVSIDKIEGRK